MGRVKELNGIDKSKAGNENLSSLRSLFLKFIQNVNSSTLYSKCKRIVVFLPTVLYLSIRIVK